MPALVTNNAASTLSASITNVATSITLSSGDGAKFPTITGSDWFAATIVDISNNLEIVKVTARSGDTLTVTRGFDGTSARAYPSGSKIELRPIAALFNNKLDKDGGAITGELIITQSDSLIALGITGSACGLRVAPFATFVQMDAVDNTLIGSWKPLFINGSTLTLETNTVPALSIDSAQGAAFSNNVSIAGTLTGVGAAQLDSTLNVVGTTTLSGGAVVHAGLTVADPGSAVPGLTVNANVGTHSAKLADSAGTLYNAGYLEIPQTGQIANYTCVKSDSGKHIYMNGTSLTVTIPSNASVPYPIGTTITFWNQNASNLSIAITADTLRLAGTTTVGTRTLAHFGIATALKLDANTWVISGTGLT